MFAPLWNTIKRELRRLTSRRIYVTMMLIVPMLTALFFIDLMKSGLPLPVPVTVVDMDRSAMSRRITRALQASQYLDITRSDDSYHEALSRLRRGDSYGFFYIPRNFERDCLNGSQPTLSYYTNMSIFVPGTMSLKGFTTTAVVTEMGVVKTTLTAVGATDAAAMSVIQPVVIDSHGLNNPWLNYSVYLNPSFISGVIALLVMLVTAFSIGEEIKRGTSPRWLDTAGGSMLVALVGKLAPQTVIFSAVGIACEALMFRFCHYPLNNHASHIIFAMVLLVIACQAFAVIICEILPNLRLAITVCSLTGILSFSVVGFSFPVDQMYGGIGILASIIPLRYFFLIYVDQALNGIPLFFSRSYYIALLVFPLLTFPLLRRLRRRCLNPVYVP